MKNITKFGMTFAAIVLMSFMQSNGATQQFDTVTNTQNVVTSEDDPVFSSWTNGADIAFNNSSPDKFKIGHQTLGQILDGKLDATNGVAYIDFKVYPTNETTGLTHLILTHESMSIGNTSWVEYKQDGITYNDETYEFNDTTNGIARLKDIPTITTNDVPVEVKDGKVDIPLNEYVRLDDLQEGITFNTLSATNLTINGKNVSVEGHVHSTNDITDLKFPAETDPLFMAMFGNSILNLIKYDEINLTGTNTVKISANLVDISSKIQGGTNSTAIGNNSFAFGNGVMAIGENSYAVGKNTYAGLYGWYYKYLNLETGTFYLTTEQPDVRKISDMGSEPEVDTTFESGFSVGDVISYVNKAKRDMYATIVAVNGNKIVVGKLNDTESEILEEHPNHDDWTIFVPEKPNVGKIWLGECAFAEGSESKAINAYSHAEGGRGCLAYGQYSHAEGKHTKAAYASHSEGSNTEANGQYSHAEGDSTKSNGQYSHAEGLSTEANFKCSHSEGNLSKSESNYAHAEGYDTRAGDGTTEGGWCSHAEGNTTIASGQQSHAEGFNTLASGRNAHSEGNLTTASGKSSHAEGSGTNNKRLVAEGDYSHAEGACTYAKGNASHAEGYNTIAEGGNSHAEGGDTYTKNGQEHAEGRFNLSHKGSNSWGNSGNTVHSIGIGTSESNRKNAVEVMQNGDVYINGIGGYDGTNPNTTGVTNLATVIQQSIQSGTTVQQIKSAAADAQIALESANDIEGIKSVLHDFFNAIK